MYNDLHVKCPLLLSGFNEILNFSTDFRKIPSSNKFHENPSSGHRVVSYGRTGRQTEGRTDRQTDANSRS